MSRDHEPRAELSQESFAKFARFDDTTVSSVVFANGIQVFGPIHTNGVLYVGSSGTHAIFHGPATSASTINSAANGTFKQGYKTNVARIELPTPASLATLSGYAALGNMTVTGGAVGTTVHNPQTRIEFVPVDINGDGDFTDENEGFIRVYRANNTTAGGAQFRDRPAVEYRVCDRSQREFAQLRRRQQQRLHDRGGTHQCHCCTAQPQHRQHAGQPAPVAQRRDPALLPRR